ncbi:major facilitator superfamily domain-containing protein [Myxozyma melibiosi]|uniref:Major facilitator superfamily domain-containing protein n=1 Tax=Myxozyma melibiosi TaxID=54550 RepID=A0ABR1EZ88_9ASCO
MEKTASHTHSADASPQGHEYVDSPSAADSSRSSWDLEKHMNSDAAKLDAWSPEQAGEGDGESSDGESTEKFEVGWDGADDPQNPYNWGAARRWFITIGTCLCATNIAWSSSVFTATYDGMEAEFGNAREISILTLTLYVFGMATGPMVYSPLSEFYGRRNIYIISFTFFVCMDLIVAFGKNIGAILAGRFLSGLAGSAFIALAGGTVSDLFPKKSLGLPMSFYTMAPLMGPSLGPITGNFISANAYWRWVPRVMLCFTGGCLIFIILFVPETFGPVLLRRKAQKLRKQIGDERYKAPIEHLSKSVTKTVLLSLKRPFQIMLGDSMVFFLCLYTSIGLGINYLFFDAFPLVFENNKGIKSEFIGLTFLGVLVGVIIGVIAQQYWTKLYDQLTAKNGGVPKPEFRLPQLIVSSFAVPIGLFGFAFTTYKSVHWIVPIILSSFFGFGLHSLLAAVFTYLVEGYRLYAASVLAGNNFMRGSFAAGFPLFGNQMFERLGYQWAAALLGFITLACIPFPILFYKHGEILRAKSKYGYLGGDSP